MAERKMSRSNWRPLLRVCKLSEEERLWLKGEGEPNFARQYGFLLASMAAFGLASLGIRAVVTGEAHWAFWRFLTAGVLFSLGWMVKRGEARAAMALIAIYPIAMVPGHLIAYTQRHAYYMDHLGFWIGSSLLATVLWSSMFYLTFRAERFTARQGDAGPLDGATE